MKNIDTSCAYCMKNENPSLYEKFGVLLTELPHSTLYLFKEQSHKGRCIVAYSEHVSEIVNLSKEEMNGFFEDVQLVAKALHLAFHPNKVNYGMYGDTGSHLHMHLCPKYADDEFEWGSVFQMDPNRNKPDASVLKETGDRILEALKQVK